MTVDQCPAALVLPALCSPSPIASGAPCREMALGPQLVFAHRCAWVSAFCVLHHFSKPALNGVLRLTSPLTYWDSAWVPLPLFSRLLFIKTREESRCPDRGARAEVEEAALCPAVTSYSLVTGL